MFGCLLYGIDRQNPNSLTSSTQQEACIYFYFNVEIIDGHTSAPANDFCVVVFPGRTLALNKQRHKLADVPMFRYPFISLCYLLTKMPQNTYNVLYLEVW